MVFVFSLSSVSWYNTYFESETRTKKTWQSEIRANRRLISLISDSRIRHATKSAFFLLLNCHLFNRIKLFILVSLNFNYKVVFYVTNVFEMRKTILYLMPITSSANQSITHLFAFVHFIGSGYFRAIKTLKKKERTDWMLVWFSGCFANHFKLSN